MQRIYVITNLLNGKQYVGQTSKELTKRLREHGGTWSGCTYVKQAMKKYGKENFSIKELEIVETIEEANIREKFWIKEIGSLAPNGYNLKEGGKKSAVHEDTKLKISLKNKGKKKPPRSEEHSRNISVSKTGKKFPYKPRPHFKGRIFSDEHKMKISNSEKGKIISKETIEKQLITKNRPYFNVYSKSTGEHLGRFNNINECARTLGIWNTTVSFNLRKGNSRKYLYEYEYGGKHDSLSL